MCHRRRDRIDLDVGADPNAGYYETHAPALTMVRSAAAARALIEAGASPSVGDDVGGSPLGRAAYLEPEVTRLLLKAGVQVDQPTGTDGRTALWQAACGGNVGVVRLLLDAGANPTLHPGSTSAVECAQSGREYARLRTASVIPGVPPYVEDFDGVIALLKQAIAHRR